MKAIQYRELSSVFYASKAFTPELFVEREEGQGGLQNGLRVRKSDFDCRKGKDFFRN